MTIHDPEQSSSAAQKTPPQTPPPQAAPPHLCPAEYRQKAQQLAALEALIDRDAPAYFLLADGHLIVAALEAVAAQLLDELTELEQGKGAP